MNIVILAAGAGRRFHSRIAKPLLPVAGEPMLAHILATARKLSPAKVVVVSPPGEAFADAVRQMDAKAVIAVQKTPAGTADAAQCAVPHLSKTGAVLVLCADTPLLTAATLRKLLRAGQKAPALLTFSTPNPKGYGRIRREGGGDVIGRIVEEKDASRAELAIEEVYAGAMALPAAQLALLGKIKSNNAAKEKYLTDLPAVAAAAGAPARAVHTDDMDECSGINTPADLEFLGRMIYLRRAEDLLERGVRLGDAARLDVRGNLRTGRDVEIDINVILEGNVSLGEGCFIGAHCILRNCRIGAGTVIAPFSHLEDATIGARCRVGPYARLRSGTALADEVRIGNFVEVKNSRLKKGAKAMHLAYLGDSAVGAGSNIGAGAITCNYDGQHKHRTVIGDEVFIGSDSQLIAPVTIGRGAYIAAGTTVTKPVPANTFAISRSAQVTRPRRK